MTETSGLPIAARQNPYIYLFILFVIVLCLVFIFIHFLQRHFKAVRTSPQWIKANSTRPTNYKDVKHFAKLAGLTSVEKDFLWKMCRDKGARNIEYLSRNMSEVDALFKNEYQDLNVLENLDDKIQILFNIRYKIEKLRERQLQIKSTRSLHPGQKITYYDNEQRMWNFVLSENSHDSMKIEVPQAFCESNSKPENFSKITLDISPTPGNTYKIITRVVRFEKDKNLKDIMVTTASDLLQPMLKRSSKRMPADKDHECFFYAVKKRDEGKKTVFDIMENRYLGTLLDVSATGCSLKCTLPIKQGQLIKVIFELSLNTVEAIGSIVVTNRVRNENQFILHIKFIKITKESQNAINAFIYGYGALDIPS